MFLLGIGLMLPGIVLAQIPPSPPAYQPMKIHQTAEPIYPFHAQQLGITSGEACIAIATDSTGKLVDHLVVGYTYPDFADAALVAVKRWRFEPSVLRGEPVGNIVEITFHFEVQGTIVTSQTILEHLEARLVRMMEAGYAFHPCPPQKLDGMPTPVTVVEPAYSKDLASKGIKGSVQVEFYIDETGAVRLPAVSANCDAVLGSLAVIAMNQWKFTPPTSKGHAVLVKAVQVFHFANGG
jgi:periplasmic protein TonB